MHENHIVNEACVFFSALGLDVLSEGFEAVIFVAMFF